MSGNKIVGLVFVLLGLFYTLAPHALHVSSALGFGLEHTWHVVLGVLLLVFGVWYGWMAKPAAAAKPARAARRARRRRR